MPKKKRRGRPPKSKKEKKERGRKRLSKPTKGAIGAGVGALAAGPIGAVGGAYLGTKLRLEKNMPDALDPVREFIRRSQAQKRRWDIEEAVEDATGEPIGNPNKEIIDPVEWADHNFNLYEEEMDKYAAKNDPRELLKAYRHLYGAMINWEDAGIAIDESGHGYIPARQALYSLENEIIKKIKS